MKIYLATLPNGFFGSAGQSWKTLDIDKLKKGLSSEKYSVEVVSITQLHELNIDNSIIIYTSSDEENVRSYLKDVMYFLNKNNKIIPSYEILLSHENKGYQELLKDNIGFGNLKGNYFFDIDETKLSFPKVLKTVKGAGSSGVFLAKNKIHLDEIKKNYFSLSLKRKIIKAQRKLKLSETEYSIYNYRHKGFSLFVEQEFIPNLENDYKVLIFGNRYYVLKRNVRKNDFRASGSGLFEFSTPPNEILDFAKHIFEKLDNPYLSLDIAQSSLGCHLIELQGTNFGPYTLINSPVRYFLSDNQWVEQVNDGDLEENFIYALNLYLDKKHV